MLDGFGCWGGIISFGCAGGLDPELASGDCVVATSVLTPDGVIATDPDWSRVLLDRLPGARPGLLAGTDAPLATAAAKAALWRDAGAVAVDMETHAAALAGLDAGGVWPVLRGLARAPGQIVPLCVLAGEAWVARRSLLRARARLGPALGRYLVPSSLPPSC